MPEVTLWSLCVWITSHERYAYTASERVAAGYHAEERTSDYALPLRRHPGGSPNQTTLHLLVLSPCASRCVVGGRPAKRAWRRETGWCYSWACASRNPSKHRVSQSGVSQLQSGR